MVDNSDHLRKAAVHRSRETRARTEKVLAELIDSRNPLTVAELCRKADVSRSWLYTQRDLVEVVTQRRGPGQTVATSQTRGQASTDESLRRRLEVALSRNRDLANEVSRLRAQLELLYGQLRNTARPAPGDDDR